MIVYWALMPLPPAEVALLIRHASHLPIPARDTAPYLRSLFSLPSLPPFNPSHSTSPLFALSQVDQQPVQVDAAPCRQCHRPRALFHRLLLSTIL